MFDSEHSAVDDASGAGKECETHARHEAATRGVNGVMSVSNEIAVRL
jgi:hypothetical protein